MAATVSRRLWLALGAGTALLGGPGLAGASQPLQHRQHPLFGSPVDLLAPAATPTALLDEVMAGLQGMHRQWNAWKPGELTRLNAAFRAGRAAPASPALQAMLRSAAVLEVRSLGLFNPGIGGLVGAWGFHDDQMRPGTAPRRAELARWLRQPPSLGQIEQRGAWLHSRNPALQLDFGAYAKGVAIDHALDHLQANGQGSALLNLGGNLAAMGTAQGRPWQIGLRSPLGEGLMASLATEGREAVVTSGSYERYRLLDGVRRSHILDPQQGAPAPELVSVTVVHPCAALADAAATALLVAGPGRWARVAERMGVGQVLLVDRHGQAVATGPLAARLRWQDPEIAKSLAVV